MKCDICNNNELNNYCTANICETCCKSMKCPIRYTCAAYPKILENIIKDTEKNLSDDVLNNYSELDKKLIDIQENNYGDIKAEIEELNH